MAKQIKVLIKDEYEAQEFIASSVCWPKRNQAGQASSAQCS